VPVIFIRFEPHLILSRRKCKNFPLHDRRACEGRGTASLILNLGFDGGVCSAHPPVVLPPGWNSRYAMNRRLGMPSSRHGGFEKEKNLASARNRTPYRLACSPNLTNSLPAGTELFRAGGRTDMTKLFYSFPNWPKNGSPNCKIIDLPADPVSIPFVNTGV